MSVPKNLTCSVPYRFMNGTTESFKGKPCYRLANSYHNAVKKIQVACKQRGESYDNNRLYP
jgi:hypothetical protein